MVTVMNARRPHSLSLRAGYTLVEVLAASGLVAAAIAASAALSMNMAHQEELTRSQACAVRYAEAVARIWQLGANPSAVLLTQPQSLPVVVDEATVYDAMSFSISAPATTGMGDDGGIPHGSVEQATVTVSYRPYGSQTNATIVLDVLRPVASHR